MQMAHILTFSCLPSSCGARTSSTTGGGGGIALDTSIFKRRSQFARKEIKTQGIQIHNHRKRTRPSTSRNETQPTARHGPGDRALHLYEYINDKNLEALEEIISEDCYFEDFSYPTPFKGKKEVLLFFAQLISSMGENVEFKLGDVSDDEETAWLDWHLEWKRKEIPFTRGCSFYECTKKGETLLIRYRTITCSKAKVFVESPIKPGGIALILLKAITTLFNNFPTVTERILGSPDAIVQWVKRFYNMFLASFVSTLLATYINININAWKFMARMLGYAYGMIIFILKIFFN